MARKTTLTTTPSARLAMTDEQLEGPVLVAFDFDGTLTVKDSFMAFLRWRAGAVGYAFGMIRLLPAAIAYLFHRKRGVIKAAAVKVFLKGVPRERLEKDAKAFAEYIAPVIFRPDALATWRRWRAKGARPVIVTASPDVLVAPFAGRVTGALLGQNCRGAEKVNRLRAIFGEDMQLAAAYGDTAGDHEMLRMAHEKGYRIFKGKSA